MEHAGDRSLLARLFSPLTRDAFLAAHWPDVPAVAHGPVERFDGIAGSPAFSSLSALLGTWREPVRVALPDKRDEHSSVSVDGVMAEAMHRAGMALILDGMERYVPEVASWLGQLRAELELPRRCNPRSIVYVSPAGGGNSPHFDANANVVVQLRGTKRWHLAPNRHVVHPTDRWAMNMDALPDELEEIFDAPFPAEMPSDSETVDLVAGSVLFVPRGYWHATESLEDSLSLNFTFGQPTWADVVLTALRRRLLLDPAWRELPSGLFSEDHERAAACGARLGERLATLERVVHGLDVEELFDAMDGVPAYCLAARAFLRFESGVAVAQLGTDEPFTIDADEALHPLLAWIAHQHRPFTVDEAATHFPFLASELSTLLDTLRARGLLTRSTQRPPSDLA